MNDFTETINSYLEQKYKNGEISKELYLAAKKNVVLNINKWITDKNIKQILPNLEQGLLTALQEKRIEHIIYAFLDDISFGTGGIRGIVAFTERELLKFAKKGINAPILRGPNTINEVVLLLKSVGVANYAAEKKMDKVVIGYDSRLQGRAFAEIIAKLFIAKNLTVYLFNRVSSFPEVAFAVPFLKADIGILISASHNDKRYNGYKLLGKTGAQFNIHERNYIYEKFIKNASLSEIELAEFNRKSKKRLVFLGESKKQKLSGVKSLNILPHHISHIKEFVLDKSLLKKWLPKMNIGYASYHGAGRNSIPPILKEFGVNKLKIIHSLYRVDGMFPCFLLEQQPDPGDPVSAGIAVNEFKKEYGKKAFDNLDILIGTDPDADRLGIVVKIPPEQREMYKKILKKPDYIELPASISKNDSDGSWMLLDADTAWTLLLWYRLIGKEKKKGNLCNSKKFIVQNHTTTDSLVYLAKKYGLGAVKTWVGFAMISDSISKVWEGKKISHREYPEVIYKTMDMDAKRKINVGAFEQSSGFSIFGGPPLPGERLGENGHIRDKDGTLAAILLTEIAAYAKSQNKTILELIDEKIYLDPAVGLFITYYEPEPYWGQYEGLTGISKKIRVLKKADSLRKDILKGENVSFGGKKVSKVETYKTGKYDVLHRWKGFPDEGIRFFFEDNKKKVNHLTIRPSGTSQCLRFHVQVKMEGVTRKNLLKKKVKGYNLCKKIMKDCRKKIELL